MKIIWMALTAACLAAFPAHAEGENFTPLPGDGTTPEWCDIASSGDLGEDGEAATETLRQRLELYNEGERCKFYLFFLYRNKTIRIEKPLVLENSLHDRDPDPGREFLTGTYLSGYGPGGLEDKLGIMIDAMDVTSEGQCAFVVTGGFSARQQIHGLALQVQREDLAVCDENGNDLMNAFSPNCPGRKRGRECDFDDLTLLVAEPPDGSDPDSDGVEGDDDLCPEEAGSLSNWGCPDSKCVVFSPSFCPPPPPAASAEIVSAQALRMRILRPEIPRNLRLCLPPSHEVRDKTGTDTDGDGIDDACDSVDNTPIPCDGRDEDQDGSCDDSDNCPTNSNSDQADRDADGLGDACDDDVDGDGIANDLDPNPFDIDGDHDGTTDALEMELGTDPKNADTDGDGRGDGLDCHPKDPALTECSGGLTVPPPAENPPPPEVPGAPAAPEEPAAKAVQGCGLQLVAPPAGLEGTLPLWQALLPVFLLGVLKKWKRR